MAYNNLGQLCRLQHFARSPKSCSELWVVFLIYGTLFPGDVEGVCQVSSTRELPARAGEEVWCFASHDSRAIRLSSEARVKVGARYF
jgi:hypothetical protein